MSALTYRSDMADTTSVRTRSAKIKANHGRASGVAAPSTIAMIRRLDRGFPYSALLAFHKKTSLPVSTIADLIQIPHRTLIRRKATGRLRPDESERLLRLSNTVQKAIDLFEGDSPAALRWLQTPSQDLENQSPLEFARTEIGARDVEDLIGRLEHGVFS
jgi:putative toxin-antitoxin system antitoxin component (TIGR02293 family)